MSFPFPVEKLSRLHFLDYIINNKDRNIGNVLLDKNRYIAIDHGLSFSGKKSMKLFHALAQNNCIAPSSANG